MQANSLVTILALFQLLCGLTLAQNHSIGSKNEMPRSLVEGRHVGLDVYDLLTEALMRALPELATPEAYRPLGIGWSSVGLANLRVSRTAERLAYGDAEFSSTRRREYTWLCNNSRQP
jgi:hypothetical protein